MHGLATPLEVRRRLQRADVLLQSSLSEGLPTVVLEAMACGLPVVATDCGGVREAVSDNIHGLVVAPRDTPAMAVALRSLAGDPELRERMGRAGRSQVESQFQLRRQTHELLALYRHAMARFEASAA
jgi:colanic acid/amylovoran biosynthesis glycosyltransferase